jgi:hypothetical protein
VASLDRFRVCDTKGWGGKKKTVEGQQKGKKVMMSPTWQEKPGD